ncbi:hypothetical protein [Paenibacillus sp. 481]|uniref:hypothetical protein n=1 Tax=Paenibacillus sp. 481 TaxID=2835869 RepID=UPI001E392733|nr:hypothetical protein [Paenibacillus sp. 481]UHA72697.1 hypothetical protein KIK04_18950 [Paenibacillus sp. 481]
MDAYIVKLKSFILLGQYCETLTEMERVCRSLPFKFHGSRYCANEEYSFGLGRDGRYFAGIQAISAEHTLQRLSSRIILGGLYRKSQTIRVSEDVPMQYVKLDASLLWTPLELGKKEVVYEFKRRGHTYEKHCVYVPLEFSQSVAQEHRRLPRTGEGWGVRDRYSKTDIERWAIIS